MTYNFGVADLKLIVHGGHREDTQLFFVFMLFHVMIILI